METSVNLDGTFKLEDFVRGLILESGIEFLDATYVFSSLNAALEFILGETINAMGINPADFSSTTSEGSIKDKHVGRTNLVSFNIYDVSWTKSFPIDFNCFFSFDSLKN